MWWPHASSWKRIVLSSFKNWIVISQLKEVKSVGATATTLVPFAVSYIFVNLHFWHWAKIQCNSSWKPYNESNQNLAILELLTTLDGLYLAILSCYELNFAKITTRYHENQTREILHIKNMKSKWKVNREYIKSDDSDLAFPTLSGSQLHIIFSTVLAVELRLHTVLPPHKFCQ